MSNPRTNLGKSLSRRSRRSRAGLADLMAELGITADDLAPLWDLKLPDGAIVQARGRDGLDAALRYQRQHGGERAVGARLHKQAPSV